MRRPTTSTTAHGRERSDVEKTARRPMATAYNVDDGPWSGKTAHTEYNVDDGPWSGETAHVLKRRPDGP
uniref:Uncharacterized protein n=1 Tax=Pristionchus pacificus TaxID=54126 RepID=A0A2A6D2U3_PRIPA|eukprot:PDM84601.1 hypothetical protein PRIPAC_33624 [Pristionchus pacificus]